MWAGRHRSALALASWDQVSSFLLPFPRAPPCQYNVMLSCCKWSWKLLPWEEYEASRAPHDQRWHSNHHIRLQAYLVHWNKSVLHKANIADTAEHNYINLLLLSSPFPKSFQGVETAFFFISFKLVLWEGLNFTGNSVAPWQDRVREPRSVYFG